MIIEQTYNLLKSRYIEHYKNLVIADCRIGVNLTAVRLSDNSMGTATTMSNEGPFCAKQNRDFGDLTPLNIRGQKVPDIIETQKPSGIISSLKAAVLNAICSKIIASGRYNIVENCDPVDLMEFTPDAAVTVVGAFPTYIRKISQICEKLFVLEINENALADEHKKLFVPAGEYKRVIPVSDIVIITGQTLVNNTIDLLLPEVKPGARVVVTGPSSNILPDILFENNVNIIGAFRITEPEILLDVVSEGGMSYHLFKYCAQKICILKDDGAQTK